MTGTEQEVRVTKAGRIALGIIGTNLLEKAAEEATPGSRLFAIRNDPAGIINVVAAELAKLPTTINPLTPRIRKVEFLDMSSASYLCISLNSSGAREECRAAGGTVQRLGRIVSDTNYRTSGPSRSLILAKFTESCPSPLRMPLTRLASEYFHIGNTVKVDYVEPYQTDPDDPHYVTLAPAA